MTTGREDITGHGSTVVEGAHRVRRLNYEPEVAGPAGPAECPQCGHMFVVEAARPAAVSEGLEPVAVVADLPQDLRVRVGVERAVLLLLEVIDGRRPESQFATRVTPPVRRYLRTAAHLHRNPRSSKVLAVRVCQPADGVAEVAAVCEIGGRPLALAARLESVHGATVWTSLRLLI